MIWAGFWQWSRAEEKIIIKQHMAAGINHTPEAIEDWQQLDDYQPVKISGNYVNNHFFLANQFNKGQAGFNVYTVFRTEPGIWLLINRGWSVSDEIAVEVSPQATSIEGFIAAWPRPGVQLGEQEFSDEESQQVTYLPLAQTRVLLMQRLCDSADCQILDRVIKLSPSAEHGFVREWQAPMMTAERHRAYAFQWFAMSLALCIIYFIYLRKLYASKT